jgi:hypothetical protein
MKAVGTFDEATHTYSLNGRPVPSVTKVLSDLLPGFRASDFYLQRGRAVHACAALLAKGIPFESDPRIAGQIEAIRRFLREVKPEILAVETQVFSERYQYAGTLDLACRINGHLLVADYKASLTPATIYQLAAYAGACPGGKFKHGVGVEIHEDGTYKMSETWELKRPFREWLALLSAFRIRERCGCLNKEEEEA